MDHIEERGIDLFRVACDRDLEGIVGKWKDGSYSQDARGTSWVKIKNPTYSQIEGRHELFERRGDRSPRAESLRPFLALT
jgi:ATP-dependent DNA ligase